jgi:hypothetical protein
VRVRQEPEPLVPTPTETPPTETGGVLTGTGSTESGTVTVVVVVVAAVLVAPLVGLLGVSVVGGTTALTAKLVADRLGTAGTKLPLMLPASGAIPAVTDGTGLPTMTPGEGARLPGMLTKPDDPPLD